VPNSHNFDDSPSNLPIDVREEINSEKASRREDGIESLTGLDNESAIIVLQELATKDDNSNVRKKAIQALSKLNSENVVLSLVECLGKNTEPFLIHEVLLGLQKHPDGRYAEIVSDVLLNEPKGKNSYSCIDCLFVIPYCENSEFVNKVIKADLPMNLQAYIIKKMSDQAEINYVPYVKKRVGPKNSENVRLAAINSLAKLSLEEFVVSLKEYAITDPSEKIRGRISSNLAASNSRNSIDLLFRQLCFDSSDFVKQQAKDALHSIQSFSLKFECLMNVFGKKTPIWENLDADLVIYALLDSGSESRTQQDRISQELIKKAVNASKNLTRYIAHLLIETSDRDTNKAGRTINHYQNRLEIDPKELEQLKIEIGGDEAISSLLEKLDFDLTNYFHDPIHRLNEQTQKEWEKTIAAARIGFYVKMLMSCFVFLAGMIMLGISFYQVIFNELSGSQLWGTGASFVSGLGGMLIVIYSGPLKDIKNAVNDLGASNSAYIAYIHRILQISHTFSANYRSNRVCYEDAKMASELIGEAMKETVSRLEFSPKKGS